MKVMRNHCRQPIGGLQRRCRGAEGICTTVADLNARFEDRNRKCSNSFTSIIQVVFAQMFDIDISMVTIRSAKAAAASAFLIVFSATGSGLPMSTISGSSTQMTGPFNQEFVNKDLRYAVSLMSANVAGDFSVTLKLGATSAVF